MTGKRTENLAVRLSPELKAALQEIADAERRSLSNLAVVILEEYVARREKAPKVTSKR